VLSCFKHDTGNGRDAYEPYSSADHLAGAWTFSHLAASSSHLRRSPWCRYIYQSMDSNVRLMDSGGVASRVRLLRTQKIAYRDMKPSVAYGVRAGTVCSRSPDASTDAFDKGLAKIDRLASRSLNEGASSQKGCPSGLAQGKSITSMPRPKLPTSMLVCLCIL